MHNLDFVEPTHKCRARFTNIALHRLPTSCYVVAGELARFLNPIAVGLRFYHAQLFLPSMGEEF